MVPAHYVLMASFPLNPNGKIDRGALPDPVAETSATEVQPSGNELEAAIADVWKKVLRTDRVGLDDNFFDLGETPCAGGGSLSTQEGVWNVRSR